MKKINREKRRKALPIKRSNAVSSVFTTEMSVDCNYRALNIISNPNRDLQFENQIPLPSSALSMEMPEVTPRVKERKECFDEDQTKTLADLYSAHGLDFLAMSLDRHNNSQQLTMRQLATLFKRAAIGILQGNVDSHVLGMSDPSDETVQQFITSINENLQKSLENEF